MTRHRERVALAGPEALIVFLSLPEQDKRMFNLLGTPYQHQDLARNFQKTIASHSKSHLALTDPPDSVGTPLAHRDRTN